MRNYLDLMEDVLVNGQKKSDRTGTGTYSVFGRQLHFDLEEKFPLLTTKKVPFRLVASELLWFLKGDTNIQYLLQHNNNIWNEWPFRSWVESDEYQGPDMTDFGHRSETDPAFREVYQEEMRKFKQRILDDDEFARKYGDLGPVYGYQWRNWRTSDGGVVDQISNVVDEIRNNPDSRRLLVNAWNPGEIEGMALPPCHYSFQFYVSDDNKLSLMWNQRSVDTFLGLPFNIASYALLTHLVAHQCDLGVGQLVFSGGDVHLYSNHIEQAKEQLSRTPLERPTLNLKRKPDSLFDYEMDDLEIVGYDPHPTIKAPISV